MPLQLKTKFIYLETLLDQNLELFLKKYITDDTNLPIKLSSLLLVSKIMMVNIFVLLILAASKIILKDNQQITILLGISLLIFIFGGLTIFLGFFQVLFS